MKVTDEMIEVGYRASLFASKGEVRKILTAVLGGLETPAPQAHLRAIADAAQAYVESVNGEPEKDCWDTEDGKEAPGAHRFASDWAWQEYDVKKQKAFDALRAALATTEGSGNG